MNTRIKHINVYAASRARGMRHTNAIETPGRRTLGSHCIDFIVIVGRRRRKNNFEVWLHQFNVPVVPLQQILQPVLSSIHFDERNSTFMASVSASHFRMIANCPQQLIIHVGLRKAHPSDIWLVQRGQLFVGVGEGELVVVYWDASDGFVEIALRAQSGSFCRNGEKIQSEQEKEFHHAHD